MELRGHTGKRGTTCELDTFVPEDVELTDFDIDGRQVGDDVARAGAA